MKNDEAPGEPPDDFEDDEAKDDEDEQEPETTVEQFEGELPDSVKQWMAEATANNIKLVKKLPEEKSRNTTKADRKCFWDLHYVLGWSNDKIAVVTGFTPETVGRHLSRMKDAEEAREEERRTSQPPGQTQQQQLSTPLAHPTFQPQSPQQPPAQPQPEPEEEEGEDVDIPDPKYMRPEQREPFKNRLKELRRIMKSEGVPKDKLENIMETVSDVDSLLETPQNLERYLWRVQRVDPEVAKVICQRLFRVESRHRHYDEYMSHQYGDHYGYGGYDEYGYPIRDDYRDGYGSSHRPPPRQYRGYGSPPDRYGRGGTGGGITEEEAKHREQEAAARAKETAEKDKQIEQLIAQVQNLQQQIHGLQENPPSQFDGPVEVVDVQEEGPDGKPVWKRITRPYESSEQKMYTKMMEKAIDGDNNSQASKEDSEKMQTLLQEKTQAQMELKMQEIKSQSEKENMTLQHALQTNQEMLAKIEAKGGAGGGGGGGEVDAELEVIKTEMQGQTEVLKELIKRGDKRTREVIDLVKFAIDPQMFATAELGKAAASSPEQQFAPEDQTAMEGWISGAGQQQQQQ